MKRISGLAMLAAAAVLSPPVAAQTGVTAADVLRAASGYISTYASKLSGVTLQEEYTLLDVSGGRIVYSRRISSDLVLLDLNGRVVGLRDPFAVDANALRERTPRITTVLARPSQATWQRAQDYANESLRYFQDEIIIRLNDPTLALRFVDPDHDMRSTFKIDGKKKIEGIETVGLAFQETKVKPPATPNYVLPTPGNAWARGKLWVEPATGRVLRTELSMQSDTETARITVEYSHDAELDLFLPASMTDTYEVSERSGASMNNMGAGSPGVARRAFDCRATYTKVGYTPIEMKVVK